MITLKMEKHQDGTQHPISLEINGETHIYNFDTKFKPEQEFFEKLKNYENFKIKVEYFDTEGNFLKETNHIIRNVKRNAYGIMALELD